MSRTKVSERARKDINNYVRRYARKHNIKPKEAREQERVKNVIAWMELRDRENEKASD
jgi:hypothetical protein